MAVFELRDATPETLAAELGKQKAAMFKDVLVEIPLSVLEDLMARAAKIPSPGKDRLQCGGCKAFFDSLNEAGLCRVCQLATQNLAKPLQPSNGHVVEPTTEQIQALKQCECGLMFEERDRDSDGYRCPSCYLALLRNHSVAVTPVTPQAAEDPSPEEKGNPIAVVDETHDAAREQSTRSRLDGMISALVLDKRLSVGVRDCIRYLTLRADGVEPSEIKRTLKVDASELGGLQKTLDSFATTMRLLESGDDRKYLTDNLKRQLVVLGVRE